MIGRRNKPDGLPFRVYERKGKFKYSIGYKLPGGKWQFRYAAPVANAELVAAARKKAIDEAEVLNGIKVAPNTTAALIEKYFQWQNGMPRESENRKAQVTLDENTSEAKQLRKVYGNMPPATIKPKHVYAFLAHRAAEGAPAKANKEIALLSAILEYGRRLGELETNPCRGIKYNKTRPRQKYVEPKDLDFAIEIARQDAGAALPMALCMKAAYLTVSRPTEMRSLKRQAISEAGIRIMVGKRKAGHSVKHKLIEWSPDLRAIIAEALQLQKISSVYVFGNLSGQQYTKSGWGTNWRKLMTKCEAVAKEREIEFTRFTLADMRPSAVTDRMEVGDAKILDATGHSDGRMVAQVYDRRKTKVAKPTK